MDVLGSASFILQNEALTQNRLATDVYALASGLRVRSAADDPSGYTIHESLDTKIAGLQQSVTNVQTGSNLLQVAENALGNITGVLQRIRSLIVEANSDINSSSDLQNIQAEIDQLLLEINKIADTTNFNGLKLFNGQFQTNTTTASAFSQAISETPAFPNQATGQTGSNILVNGTGAGTPSPFMTIGNLINGQFVPTFVTWSIVSSSNNMVDPDTGANIGPGVLIQEVAYSTSSAFGPTQEFVDYSAFPTNAGALPGVAILAPSAYPPYFQPNFIYNGANFGNVTAADVGAQAAFLTVLPQQPTTGGHALAINDGGDEGQALSISIPELNTSILNISNISVLAPGVTTVTPVTQVLATQGAASSNQIAASYAEIVTDRALDTVNTTRAQIGAQTVALQQDADNASVTIVNETAASSNIRDANIGATVTDFTKQQILVNVGNSVLAQMETDATQLTALLLNSFSGLGAAQGAPAITPGGG